MPIATADVAPPILAVRTQPAAVSIDAYAGIASQYVYRGIAMRDRPTPTFALATSAHGWFADIWGGLVDVQAQDYSNSHGTVWNVDSSVGYGASIGADWQWSLAAARIVDVGEGNRPSENYTEWRANLFLRCGASIGCSAEGRVE